MSPSLFSEKNNLKICLPVSAGGHLRELSQLSSIYLPYSHFYITFKRDDTLSLAKKEKVYFIERPARNPFLTLKSFFQTLKILLEEKPNLILTTGADVSLASCYLGKLLGAKIIFIESFCRTEKPSLTARLVYPISNLFIYQWQSMKKYFPRGVYGGPIF